MQSILQILKVNDAKSGLSKKTGNAWEMQDCECIVLNEDGSVAQVGVLMLPKDLRGKVQPGVYIGTFALRPDFQTRQINAVLTGLQPYQVKALQFVSPPAPVAPKAQP